MAGGGTAAAAEAATDLLFDANRAVSRLALQVGADQGVTRRRSVVESGSLRLRFPRGAPGELEAVVVNTGGGVAGGDRISMQVGAETGARLTVTSTAAEKIYRSHGPDARIALSLAVASGATLHWLPQETILFDRAALTRSIDVDLAEGARLVMGEAVVLGRSAMGETVVQGRLIDRWRVRRDGRLVFADALRLDGGITAQLAPAAAGGGACAMATLLVAPGDEDMAVRLRQIGESARGEIGVSAWNGLLLARFIAADGAALRPDLMAALARLGTPLPRLWLN